MAQLPDVAALGERPTPQPAGGTASYEPPNWRQVGMGGQIIASGGHDLEEAAGILAATNDRQDIKVAQAAVNSLQQARTTQEFDPTTGFRNAKEGQAVGQQFVDTYTQKFSDAQSQLRDGLANPNQKQIFDQHASLQALQFKSALLTHQAQQTEKFNDSTDNGTLKLALTGMATRPQDELNFQTGMAQINGTIDAMGKRKGLPDAAVKELKSQYLDAAYSTRITSVMDGIPGVAPANPYLAEKMFKQMQDQLGPASQVHLANAVQKSVQSVQARDTASQFIFGTKNPVAPSTIAPATVGIAPLQGIVQGIVQDMESGGDVNAVSPKGARGAMQVMPATSSDPGFGVKPAQMGADGKVVTGELERVGRDYLGAMTARYNDPALVMAAYNAGPGQVDQWIKKFGDPRAGQISTQDWVSKIPFAETQNYVVNGLRKLNAAGGAPDAQIQAPTANQLKTDLYARVQNARKTAEEQYPGDTAYADAVASRTENYGRTVIANQQGVEAGARDGLFQGLVGSKADGSDKPMTIDALLTDPQQKANWDKATPETKLAIQSHFKNGASDPPRTADTQATLYRYMGMAANNREGFASEDLSPLISKLPHTDFDRLATMQMGARNKAELAADKGASLSHALSLSLSYALKPIGIQEPTKDTPQSKRVAFDQFTGALMTQLDQFQTQNKRPANDAEIVSMAKNLTTTVQVPGAWFGSTDKRAFEITPDTKIQPDAVPKDFRLGITSALTTAQGKPPTESQVQTAYLLHLRQPPKPKGGQ